MSTKRQIVFHGFGRGQVRVLAWEYAPNERVSLHSHAWHQLIYAVAGVMTIETSHGTWIVPTHRAVWVPARMEHAIEMSGTVDMRTLYFSPRLAWNPQRECRVVTVPALVRELLLYTIALGGLDRRVARQRLVLELLLDRIADLQAEPVHLMHVQDPRAQRVAKRVIALPGERLSLTEIAKQSGASKRTIERAFVLQTGMTFGRWRQQVRLAHALRLLAGKHSVTSVALECGYDSVSAFVNSFKQVFGKTPGRYYRAEP